MHLQLANLSLISATQLKTASITLIVVFVYFLLNRTITQVRTNRRLNKELAQRDNCAYGISYAGSIFAFVLIASEVFRGLSFSDPVADTLHAIVYATMSLCFLELGRYIYDNFILFKFDGNQAINQKNIAGAFVDAGSMIANAIIIMAIYRWTGANTLDDLPIIIIMFLVCQLQLLMLTRWREYRYAKANQGDSMQRTLSIENQSLSIQHAGYIIAAALAVKAAAYANYYLPAEITTNTIHFFLLSSLLMIAIIILSALGSKIVLARINSDIEIGHQDNIGIATVEFAVLVGFGLVMVKIFS